MWKCVGTGGSSGTSRVVAVPVLLQVQAAWYAKPIMTVMYICIGGIDESQCVHTMKSTKLNVHKLRVQ
jgi:hypothetical protein